MKKLTVKIIVLLLFSNATYAQVAINTDGGQPNPSAMLEVKSNDKGILIPRMSQEARNSIASPATGLLIYQTDIVPGFYYNFGDNAFPIWTPVGTLSEWSLSGNYLTGLELFGSKNFLPVKIFTNNIERLRISETGNVGI
jgi:trimeric autotransporter adhesin